MRKSDKVIPIASLVKSRPKCGDCLHYKRIAKFEKVCSLLGIKHYTEAPECFDVDVYILATQTNPDVLFQLAALLRGWTPQQVRVFLAMMRERSSLEKNYGVEWGQPVMFRIGGGDYLSNYFRGFVIGGSKSGDPQVYVTSDMSKTQRKAPATATLLPSSVFPLSKWKKKKEQLIKEKRLKDPNPLYSAHVDKKDLTIDYVVPTLENAPAEWFDKVAQAATKSKKALKSGKDGSLTFKVDRE